MAVIKSGNLCNYLIFLYVIEVIRAKRLSDYNPLMGYFNKTWKATLSTGEEIRVENRNSFKKTQECIYIGDECVYSAERSHFQELWDNFNPRDLFKTQKNFLVNKRIKYKGSVILVTMGWSHGLFLFCEIIENGYYILGSSQKPRSYPSLFNILMVMWVYPFVIVGLPLLVNIFEIQNELGGPIEKSDPKLWSKDFRSYRIFSFNDDLFYRMKEVWEKECKAKNDHNCRFLYYLHSNELIKLKEIDGIDYIKLSCTNNELRSCYAVLENDYIPKTDELYSHAYKLMSEQCNTESLEQHEMKACKYFYRIKFKETGDSNALIADNKKLCSNGYKDACEEK